MSSFNQMIMENLHETGYKKMSIRIASNQSSQGMMVEGAVVHPSGLAVTKDERGFFVTHVSSGHSINRMAFKLISSAKSFLEWLAAFEIDYTETDIIKLVDNIRDLITMDGLAAKCEGLK